MATFWQDVKYGIRMLARNLVFTAVVVVILSISIGANTAIFSVVNGVMLRPLPYRHSHRIVVFRVHTGREERSWVSLEDFRLWRERAQVFDALAAYGPRRFYVAGIEQPHETRAFGISSGLLSLLGASPLMGRDVLPEEERPGNDRIIILSHSFWQSHMRGAPDVLGKTVLLNNQSHTVVGVMPPGFEFPFGQATPFWVPLALKTEDRLYPLARLKEGVTLRQARAVMAILAKHQEQTDPQTYTHCAINVDVLLDRLLEGKRKLPLLLLGAAGLVLLIACSNLANLCLVRTASRQQEIALRLALGASRIRVIRQMLTENLVLSGGGGLIGLLLVFALIRELVSLCPTDIPRLNEIRVDLSVLIFTFALSVLTGLVFGLMPAWRASDVRAGESLKEGTLRHSLGRGWRHLHSGLVVSQIGLSLVLLIGAGLLMRSLIALQRIELGFRPENVLAAHIMLPDATYPESHHARAFNEALLQRIRALPGVRATALMCFALDLGTGPDTIPVSLPGQASARPDQQILARWAVVSPAFFRTMGIELLRGRSFIETDTLEQVIIDEKLAQRCFGSADPLGKILDCGNGTGHVVVGVVGTTRDYLTSDSVEGSLFMRTDLSPHRFALVVRTQGDPENLVSALRAQVAGLTGDQVITKLETVQAKLLSMLAPRRSIMILVSLFAGTALMIASIGIYGLVQFNTARQTRDIGIRMAMGAQKKDILRATLGYGLKLTLIGTAIGMVAALAFMRVLSSFLYEVTPADPLTLVCTSLVLIVTALVASYFPAQRAARIDPMVALRCE